MPPAETDSVLYLSREDVVTVDLSMPVIIEAVERMFREKGEGRVEMPPKPGIHTQPDAFIHAMPAYIPSLGATGPLTRAPFGVLTRYFIRTIFCVCARSPWPVSRHRYTPDARPDPSQVTVCRPAEVRPSRTVATRWPSTA